MTDDELLFEKDPSTLALIEFEPIYEKFRAWVHKYGFLLSHNQYKHMEQCDVSMRYAVHDGLAKDERYIYERSEEVRTLIRNVTDANAKSIPKV